MRALLAVAVAVVVLVARLASDAHADEGVVFVDQPVRAPVALDRVLPVAPFVPAGVPEVAGAIAVGPDRGAALWLDALDVIAVRGEGVKLARVVGSGAARATLAETGARDHGVTYVVQPPGGGDVWMIWAERSTTIRVERPVARAGRAIWETTQRALLAWVDAGGARPAIPVADGAAVAALQIDGDAATGAALEAMDASLREAVRAWRKASVVAELAAIRPFVQPQLRVEPLDTLPGMAGPVTIPDPAAAAGAADPAPYQRVAKPHTIEVELAGPGALRIEARALLPAPRGGASNAPELPDVTVAIASRGTTLARRTVAATYATLAPAGAVPPAFPPRHPVVSREGDTLGERVAVTVPLFPGTHRYRVTLEGGPLAVRATVARHRPRIVDVLAADDVDELLADARAALRGTSQAAKLLGALIDGRAGTSTPPNARAGASTPAHARAPADARAPIDVARWNLARGDKAHAWIYALAVARRTADADAVRALYARVPGSPAAALVPDLLALLPRATPLERVRNWPLAATLMAVRAAPVDPSIGSAARARWRTAEWAQLAPVIEGREHDDLPPPRRWLVEAEPAPLAVPRAWKPGDLARVVPGQPRTVIAQASLLDPARAALLDVYLEGAPRTTAAVTVDDTRFATMLVAGIERLQVAVAPGPHTIAIERGRAWVSQRPATALDAGERARVQALWPTRVDGARLRWALPAADVPVELALRARAGTRVVVRGDVGPATELVVTADRPDARAHALFGGGGDAMRDDEAGELRFVYWPARGARALTFDGDAYVSVATRRERTTVPPPAAADRAAAADRGAATDLLDRVAAASRALAKRPGDAALLAARASDLLDLGEPSLAREDLVRMLHVTAAHRTAAAAAAEEALVARLDDATEPTHVTLATPARAPVLVGPALAVLVTAEDRGALAAAIEARRALARGDAVAAAKLLAGAYQATERWQVALEAVDVLARVLADRKATPPAGTYALAYGLASRVRASIDHPRVRRALVLAAAQSGWDTLGAVATSAGHEALLSTRPILPLAPSVLVREALVAPAWPARSAHTITAGNAGVLDVTLPAATTVRAQIHCVRVRSAELTRAEATAPCALAIRTDNGAPKPVRAALGEPTELAIPVTAGRHVVEVALASEGDAASVRFLDGATPIRIEKKTKLFTASVATPVTTNVQGPTTLWVQARSSGGAHSAVVTATSSAGAPVRAVLELAQDRDGDARGDGRALVVSSPSDTFLVLPEATTYQVSVQPDRGELVTRLALRDERRGKQPRAPGPWYAAAPVETAAFELAMPPTVGTIAARHASEPAPGRAGTLSIDVRAEQDSRGDEDVASSEPGNFVETGVAWRRALAPRRVWLAIRAGVRAREETATIATGAGELAITELPLGASLAIAGTGYTQAFSEGRAWHLRGRARLGASWALGDTLALRPALSAGASYLNTTPATAMVATERLDPDIYSTYRETHRRDGTASLALHWQPLQDLAGELRASATTNADLGSLDHTGGGATLRMLAPLPLVGDTLLVASYLPNYRFADDDRPRAYWRHDVTARIEWTFWATTQGRFVLAAWDEYTTRHALGAGLRFDLVRHRGLADFAPADAPFASLVDERAYAPLEAP